MKRLLTSIIFILAARCTFASVSVDSLQKQLEAAPNDSVKAAINFRLAESYMNYNTILDKDVRTAYQENALKYTLAAIHNYSRIDDTVSLRACYDRLAHVYHDQKKYSQAKWFILQANTLARAQNDVPNIVSSLITLAQIKMDIKDYYLAKGDLQEALTLSAFNCLPDEQAQVMLTYARYYNSTHKPDSGKLALKRYAYMRDSMRLDSQKQQVAKLNIRKKFYMVSNRVTRNTSTRSVSL